MSVLDSFFNRGFKAAKCKTLLKLSIPRIKLLRNRREIQIKRMRRDIAKLLETGQEATARIRVEHIVREENMMAAQEVLELFSELIAVRLPIIETQRECPLDLKEAVSSVCFAAPRCADLPELLQVQMLFASKYGKEFVLAATELMPDCGVNRQLIGLLSVRAPSPETKLKLLKEIAEEHELDWDPEPFETELLKPCEDLLNGSTRFTSESKLLLPKEKHEETLHSAPDQVCNEQPDSDPGFDLLDFPEVPNLPLGPSVNAASVPKMVPPKSATPHSGSYPEPSEHAVYFENESEPHLEPQEVLEEGLEANNGKMPNIGEDKQFLPFISPPSLSTPFYSTQTSPPSSASFSAKHSPPPSPPFSTRQSSPLPSIPYPARQSSLPQSLSRTKSDAIVDFHDVLAAAQAAAESAEHAAAAARSAASLAQVRIAELTKRKIDRALDNNCDYPFSTDLCHQSATEKPQVNRQNSSNYSYEISHSPDHEDHLGSEGSDLPPLDTLKVGFDASLPHDHVIEHKPVHHQPHRLPSMDDDPYFSYPNLFTSQNCNIGSDAHSFTDKLGSAP